LLNQTLLPRACYANRSEKLFQTVNKIKISPIQPFGDTSDDSIASCQTQMQPRLNGLRRLPGDIDRSGLWLCPLRLELAKTGAGGGASVLTKSTRA
jgi:hypothetical protein